MEFGLKLDVSIDGEGYGRIEKVFFAPYSEGGNLIAAVERYRERTGQYPERVLADRIYRTKENRAYCREHGIRLSGPKLGRPSKKAEFDKKQEHQDNTDRIEVERFFSRSKRCFACSNASALILQIMNRSEKSLIFFTKFLYAYKDYKSSGNEKSCKKH